MLDRGLREVTNPSQVFLAERRAGTSGSAVVAGVEGTRPILLEVQALVAPASYGVPQRTATGFDTRRLQMLLAVLEKRVGLHVGQYDVFVNVAGGVRIDEPAADLGMALSIVSSLRDQPVDPDAVVTGEIGLGGEIRRVFQVEKRIMEAQKLGFTKMLIPSQNLAGTRTVPGIEILEAASIEEAIGALITQRGKR
jgi:DNA repair protein RadA/Sms